MRLVRGDVVAGQYEVERHLDGAAPLDTYLARHLMAGRKVRLKVLQLDEPWSAAFAADTDAWAHVEDDAWVPCLAAGQAGKKSAFFAFGWEQGPTLAESLNGPSLPELVLELGKSVAGALASIHDRGLVHGHVRPSQIVLCQMRNGAPRLLDPIEPPTSWIIGTAPTYLAPEVVAGDAPTPASDVYGLGMTLATVVNGAVWAPTEGRVGRLLAALVGLRPALPPDDPALSSWINRMIAADPAERPDAAQVHDVFRTALEGAPLPALPAPSPALAETAKGLAVLVLKPPGARSAEAAGLDDAWRHAVEAHGTRVQRLIDQSLLCRVERGSLRAIITTVGLVVRASQEHAFRASVVCGLPVTRAEGENLATLLSEVSAIDHLASRTPAGVTRFTARLAAELGGTLPFKPSGDAFVLTQSHEGRRAPKRNGTLEMDAPAPRSSSSGGKRRKTSEIAVSEPRRAGRGGTLVMEPATTTSSPKRKKGGTLEIVVEAPTPSPAAPARGRQDTAELFLDDREAGGPPPERESCPTLEVVVDPELVEATRTGSPSRTSRRSTWSRRSS